MKRHVILSVALFCAFALRAQEHNHVERIEKLEFVQNEGQWDEQAQYMANLNGGRVWFESNRFTYDFMNMEHVERMHEENHGEQPYGATSLIDRHVFYMNFIGANEPNISAYDKQDHYYNYFLGNDPDKWASNVPVYHGVEYWGLYDDIGLVAFSQNGNLKYDYHVFKGGDPSEIRFSYEHADKVAIVNGALVITTSVGDIIEQEPVVFQNINGAHVAVACQYAEVEPGIYGFEFPSGYNKNYTLIIDPTVIASTYSGTTSTVYGHTATYDDSGNIFSAGAGFSGGGYPTTAGAYQTSPNGGREFTITKYVPDGSAQIWATHIGGTGDDYPHSMVVNAANELYVLGSSSSSNYPTTGSAYSTTNAGGTDIVVSALSSDGSTLLASTYVGGTATDGQNSIADNYGDAYKGEIYIDPNGDVYVASMSQSTNFPTVGAIQPTSGGGTQDGVLVKLPANLSALTWSTYLGGSGTDAAYSVVTDGNDDVYVCGTATNGYGTTAGTFAPAFIGGSADGFVSHISSDGTTLLASTFLGTGGRDQAFFVRLDKFDEVYVNGQTDGGMVATPGAYTGPSTGSYIQRLPVDLSTVNLTSTYGSTAPTAFLVDDCNNIYAAGHGGLSQLTTSGFDASATAFDTDGAGFYLMVLTSNATALEFGTFYGNNGAHVDGGTSRFDPQGVVYENVCSSAGSPTMPWAYATASSASWDSYVFKIDFEATGVDAVANVDDLIACGGPPYDVPFDGSGAVDYYWDFGDGSGTSTLEDPTYTYADTGTYTIMYVAIDSATCNIADTAYATIQIIQPDTLDAVINPGPWDPCEPDSMFVNVEFTGTGADSIVWDMGDGTIYIDDTLVNHYYTSQGEYIISMTAWDQCGNVATIIDTVDYSGMGFNVNVNIDDYLSCTDPPYDVPFTGDGGVPDHYWDFGDGSGTSVLQDPIYTYADTGTYTIMYVGIDSSSCNIADTAFATIVISQAEQFAATWSLDPPGLCDDTLIFDAFFSGSGADSIVWDMGDGVIFINDTAVYHTYVTAGTYTVTMTAYDYVCNNVGTISQTFVHDPFVTSGIIEPANVFSPNGDGHNDEFRLTYLDQPWANPLDDLDEYHAQIYNRWGDLVYETGSNPSTWPWDGKVNGNDPSEGVYYYIISYKYVCDEEPVEDVHGHVTLTK